MQVTSTQMQQLQQFTKALVNLTNMWSNVLTMLLPFNTCINSLIEGLSAHGKTSTDSLTNLFVGYLACSDQEFRTCTKEKENKHEEGEDLTHQELMLHAANKHKIRKT